MNSPSKESNNNGSAGALSDQKKLHPSSLWVPLLALLPKIVIPAVIAFALMGLTQMVFLGLVYVLIPFSIYHVVRFLTFSYQLGESELLIQSGLFWRSERRIPLARIQDIKASQSIFHQIFKVVRLEITTAASEESEVVLDVISQNESEALRNAVLDYQAGIGTWVGHEESAAPPDYSLYLSLRELLLGGLTSRIIGTLFALFGAILYFTVFLTLSRGFLGDWGDFATRWEDDFIPKMPGLPGKILSFFFSWDDTLIGSVFLVLGGLSLFLAGFILRNFNFKLFQRGDVVTKSQGLFTVRRSSLSRVRLQALKIEETLLRRWFKLATIWADSGGDRSQLDDEKKREALVPVTSRVEAFRLAETLFANLSEPEPQWQTISRKAVMRESKLGWAILTLAILVNCLPFGWFCLVFLPGYPLIYYISLQRYRNTGYWINSHYLISRKGWFTRTTLYLSIRNLQNITLKQNFFDRRLRLATLSADTAGQSNTGGGPTIHNIPIDEARGIQESLAKRVSRMAPSTMLASSKTPPRAPGNELP